MPTGVLDLSALPFPIVLRPGSCLSDEEFLHFSACNNPWQMERNAQGEILIMTPVTGRGGFYEMYVSGAFSRWLEEDNTGIAFSPSTGFKVLDGSTRSPDLAWLPLTRWNELSDVEQESFIPVCPAFLIEIRSKSDRRSTVEDKMQMWMENGAQLAWLIDPIEATVTIYHAGHETQTLERPDSVTATDPVAGFTLNCKRLWPAV